MKYLATHRKDLMAIMEEIGLDPDQFDYVKRKGRIHIVDPDSGRSFWYFRRKETKIHPETKQWVELESYEAKLNNAPILTLDSWQDVLHHFREWSKSD